MQKDVAKYVRLCGKVSKSFTLPCRALLALPAVPEYPWEVITLDLMGPYPKGNPSGANIASYS
jgi:hypothetical protein